MHTTASHAQASEYGLQQQVDRLQQELAKSEQRAEGGHASVQRYVDLWSISTL